MNNGLYDKTYGVMTTIAIC